MRLRPLSEAECYTRCYGGKPGERISVIRVLTSAERRELKARRASRVREERAA